VRQRTCQLTGWLAGRLGVTKKHSTTRGLTIPTAVLRRGNSIAVINNRVRCHIPLYSSPSDAST